MLDGDIYELRQFHFHTPSEHVINDVRYQYLEVFKSESESVYICSPIYSCSNCTSYTWDRDENTAVVVSPRKSSRRKAGPEIVITGKDEVVEDTEKREAGGRLSNIDSAAEEEPAYKRPKLDQNEDPAFVVSPKKSPRRKARPQVVSIGKDEVVEVTERIEPREGTVANGEFGAAANQGWRGCSRPKTRGSRKVEQTSSIPREDSHGIESSLCNVRREPWDPMDSSHVQDVKKALHLSEVPETILCRDTEQANVIDFCKACIVEQRAGSIYIYGCTGTGKSLTVENVKLLCTDWSKQAGTLHPEIIDTMARALSRIFRSPVVETIQSLPRHQQMVLCAAVRNFRRVRKDSNVGELNTGYLEFCKLTQMQPLTPPEFSKVCQVLADQALLKIGTSREDRLRRVTLKADEEDVIFALQRVRFLGNYLGV